MPSDEMLTVESTHPKKSEPSDDFSLLSRFLSWTMLKSASLEKSVLDWFISLEDFLLSNRRMSSNLTFSWSPLWKENIFNEIFSVSIIILTDFSSQHNNRQNFITNEKDSQRSRRHFIIYWEGPGCVLGLKRAGGRNQFNVFPPSPNDGREASTLTDKRPQ